MSAHITMPFIATAVVKNEKINTEKWKFGNQF